MSVLKFMRRAAAGTAIAIAAAGLTGCVEQVGSPQADANPPSRIAARPGVSPAGAPLAIVSIEGLPAPMAAPFDQQLRAAAASRQVAIAEPARAFYLTRGYLNAYPIEGGAAVAIVWDMFDGQKRRLQRVEDAVVLKGAAQDPWGLVDERAVAALAARSAEDIAAFLTNTPEAIGAGAVARATPSGPFPQAPAPASANRALSFAPVEQAP